MLILFLLIPPDNKVDPKCFSDKKNYQEKILDFSGDFLCIFKHIAVNIETRKNNFGKNSVVIEDSLKTYKNLKQNSSSGKINIESLDKLKISDENMMNEIGIDKNELDKKIKINDEEYNKLMEELSN